jgi:preprotein translocase SecE subunit
VAEKRQRAKQRQAARREQRQAERGGDGAPGGSTGTPGGGVGTPGGGTPGGGVGAPGGAADSRREEAARARDPERQEIEENVDLEVGAPPEDIGFSEFTTRHAGPPPPDFEFDDDELADGDGGPAEPPRTRGPRGFRGDGSGGGRGRGGAAGASAGGAERRERARVLEFLRAVWAELQRVQWPNRKQLTQLTGVVLFFVVVVGAYLGALDAIFSKLISSIL